MCEVLFTKHDQKVRNHCHYTRKFSGAAHNNCNLKYRRPTFTPAFFHNFSKYDVHLYTKDLMKTPGDIYCIPISEET